MTISEFIFAFLSGFSVCAVLLGTLWFLRECERAKAHKFLREDNARLRVKDRQWREMLASYFVRIHEFRLEYGERALLPAPAKQVGQRSSLSSLANCAGSSRNGGSDFSRRGA
jgi:hypothetical protein